MKKMTAVERKIVKVRTKMLLGHPFWGSLTLRLDKKEDKTCKTIATDGKSLFYNPDYVEKRESSDLLVDMCSLVGHIMLGHIWRREGRDPWKWNRSCDLAVNAMLKKADIALPDDYVCLDQFQKNSSEQIFNMLPDGDGGGGGGGGSQDKSDFGPGEVRDYPQPEKQTEAQAEWEVAVRQAAQVAKSMGKLPGSMEALVNDVMAPPCDWKSFTRRFVQETATADYSWKRPNRKYINSGVYLPSLRSEQMPPIVIALDTSWSTKEYIDPFCALINDIIVEAKPEYTLVVSCDSKVHNVEEFLDGDPIKLHPKGMGGTNFEPVFRYVEENGIEPACLIFLTDLEGPWDFEPPSYPVLWVSCAKHVAPWGETIYMEE